MPPQAVGWWPALWELNEEPNTAGGADELDNMEQVAPILWGTNVVQQTEQCYASDCSYGNNLFAQTTVATGDSAQHTYAALATSSYVGFYVDNVAKSTQFTRFSNAPLMPIINFQVCTNNSWCEPAPAAGATAQMIVKYYRYYAPPATSDPCPTPYDVPALPT